MFLRATAVLSSLRQCRYFALLRLVPSRRHCLCLRFHCPFLLLRQCRFSLLLSLRLGEHVRQEALPLSVFPLQFLRFHCVRCCGWSSVGGAAGGRAEGAGRRRGGRAGAAAARPRRCPGLFVFSRTCPYVFQCRTLSLVKRPFRCLPNPLICHYTSDIYIATICLGLDTLRASRHESEPFTDRSLPLCTGRHRVPGGGGYPASRGHRRGGGIMPIKSQPEGITAIMSEDNPC